LRLEQLDKENTNNMTWMICIIVFVILLSLEYIDEVLFCLTDFGDVKYLILSFPFMIWWVWNLKFSLACSIIDLKESIFGEAVLKTKSIKSDRSYLYS
jgi:hypothetical protein